VRVDINVIQIPVKSHEPIADPLKDIDKLLSNFTAGAPVARRWNSFSRPSGVVCGRFSLSVHVFSSFPDLGKMTPEPGFISQRRFRIRELLHSYSIKYSIICFKPCPPDYMNVSPSGWN